MKYLEHGPQSAGGWSKLLLAAGLAMALGAAALPAAAAASALVEWEAPEACPGAADVFERLSASLGYEPQTLGKLSRVRGNVVAAAHGYRLSLEVDEGGRRSSRWLEAPSCEDLVDAAVLAITLALAPEQRAAGASDRAATQEPADAEAGAGEAAAVPPDADTSAEPEREVTRVRGVGSAGVAAELGALPEPALGVTLSAGAEWTQWSLSAYGTLFLGQRLAVRPGQYVEFELTAGGLRGCRRWLQQPLTLDTCAELEAGRWEALGVDLVGARRARELWLAPGAGLAAGIELLPGLALLLQTEAVVPLTRRRYIVNENEGVHTPAGVSWRFVGGLSLGTP